MSSEESSDPARYISTNVAIGTALISLIEPEVGYERAFNRWYADDHFYAGALNLPSWYAGRRWVATKELRSMREPATSTVVSPIDAGCYLHTYFILPMAYEGLEEPLVAVLDELFATDRMLESGGSRHRTSVYTAFQSYAGAAYLEATGPRDIHALHYPYDGLVFEMLDTAPNRNRADLVEWLTHEHVPRSLVRSGAAMCLAFVPLPLRPRLARYVAVRPTDEMHRRVNLLWFTKFDPREQWQHFQRHSDEVAASRLGRLQLSAPFIPTVPGTDRYVDELR